MTRTSGRIVVLGLSLSSSWGNGHATTYRALLRGLAEAGHRALFLERDVPWYARHRDLLRPPFADLVLYRDLADLDARLPAVLADAAAVIIGSFVPDGIAVIDLVLAAASTAVAFYDIDTPVTLARLAAGDCPYLAPRQVPAFDLYLSFSGGPVPGRIATGLGARRAVGFYCSVDPRLYRPKPVPRKWDLGYLGTYSPDRQPALERLLLAPARLMPWQRFVVAGAQYPADIAWPANVQRIEHVPPADHADFYGALGLALNLTRADMVAAGWSPSVRLFEAAACGTPILSDRWPGLGDLFPEGEAILTAADTADVVGLLATLDEARRHAIGQAGRARVLAGHTGAVRARQLLDLLQIGRTQGRPVSAGFVRPARLGDY